MSSSMISPIGLTNLPATPSPAGTSKPSGAFQTALEEALVKVEEFRQTADKSVERFLSGESEELHQSLMATQRAELALELLLGVRNKVVQAYQEIMRMQM